HRLGGSGAAAHQYGSGASGQPIWCTFFAAAARWPQPADVGGCRSNTGRPVGSLVSHAQHEVLTLLNSSPDISGFAQPITIWQKAHGRRHLPWQGTQDPYRIWLS